MLQYHFALQLKLINRKLKDFGLELVLAYIILPVLFIVISNFVLDYSEHSKYVYALSCILQVIKLGTTDRNNFLKYIYNKDFFRIRGIENLIVVFPFIGMLLYKQDFLVALLLFIASLIPVFFTISLKSSFVIPTPFSKKPFEFIIGFRKTFWVFLILYYITYQAISYSNFNLGVVCVFASFLSIMMTYYQKLEKPFYVWIFSLNPKQFLFKKINSGIINTLLITLPIIISLGVVFPDKITILLLIVILSKLYLTAFILAKYATYPFPFSISQTVILVVGFIFPPALAVIIPYFYKLAIHRISPILNDAD